MERPQHLISRSGKKLASPDSGLIIIGLIILFHLVGLVGLAFASARPLFLKLVPWHLLLMFLLMLVNHRGKNRSFLIFTVIIFALGFIAEWIGVHSNILFGHYQYGNTLGVKVSGIPLTMGINWFALIYGAGILTDRIRLKNTWARIIAGAVLLVLLDFLIEPVATRFNYWHWQNNSIPPGNYVGWLIVSIIMLYLFDRFTFKKQNWAAPILLLSQFVFFGVLCLIK